MEGSARFAEDPRAKGTWGRLLEREGQNPIQVSSSSLAAMGMAQQNGGQDQVRGYCPHRPPLYLQSTVTLEYGCAGGCEIPSLSLRALALKVFRAPLCSPFHSCAFSSQPHKSGVLCKRREPPPSSLSVQAGLQSAQTKGIKSLTKWLRLSGSLA